MKLWLAVSIALYTLSHVQTAHANMPAPQNLQFFKAQADNVSITFDGLAGVSQYEVDAQALYNKDDRRGWIMTLATGATTSTIRIDKITGLNRNIIYKVRVAGRLNEVTGNSSEVIVRTAATEPSLRLGQALPTVLVVFVSETPGATLCEISYTKPGQIGGEISMQSDEACRVGILKGLEPNTAYTVRARVLEAGGYSYPDSQFGSGLQVTTAQLSLFGKIDHNVSYSSDLANPDSSAYIRREAQVKAHILSLYHAIGADATDVNILEFVSKDSGAVTTVHHEVLLNATSYPVSLVGYSFVEPSGLYVFSGITESVRPNAYSLLKSGENYQLDYGGSPPEPCSSFDIKRFVVTGSMGAGSSLPITLQGLSLLSNLEIQITGSEMSTGSGASLHSFENNSANVITQNYLLKSCDDGSTDHFYTRYYSSPSETTTSGFEDVFIHSTKLTSFPDVRSVGIERGNGSLVTVRRMPNAIEYFVTSGSVNTTINFTKIDSSSEFSIRVAPLTPGVGIETKLEITTQPYDVPLKIEGSVELSTLPSFPLGVTWPYRDKYNLTLKWDEDEAALGYYIQVISDRDSSTVQEFENKEPVAAINNLMPGRYYLVRIVPYNYAGNTTTEGGSGYRLYTDDDPIFLSPTPVNTTHDQITIDWTGGEGANVIEIGVHNGSEALFSIFDVPTPYIIQELQPDTEYNVTVIATFDTGTPLSQYRTFRTDPPLTTTAPEITTEVLTTTFQDTLGELTTTLASTAQDSSASESTISRVASQTLNASTLMGATQDSQTLTPGGTGNSNSSENTQQSATQVNDSTDGGSESSASDQSLDWWVWLLIGVGVVILLAVVVVAAKLISTSRQEQIPQTIDEKNNKTGIMKSLFGASASYAVNKGPPPAMLTMEKFRSNE